MTKLPGRSEWEESDLNLREYLFILVKRRWLLLLVLALCVTISLVYSFHLTPTYRTSASIYIDRSGYAFVPDVLSEAYSWQQYESFFNTQYKLLTSKSLARRVVDRLHLTTADLLPPKEREALKSSTVQDREEEVKSIVSQLQGMLEIVPVKSTNLCDIVFTTPDPKLSMTLANTWAEEYVEYSLASQYEYTQKAEVLLGEQIRSLQAEIAEKEKILQDYSLEKQVVKLDNDQSMSSKNLEGLNNSLTEATRKRIGYEVHYNDLKNVAKDTIPEVTNSLVIQQLRTEYSSLERQYSEKSKMYKPDYPEMVRLNSQMEQLQKRIGIETEDIYQNALATANSQYQESAAEERVLQKQMQDLKRQSVDSYRKEFSYDRFLREINNKKELLESLLKKQNETGVSAQLKDKKATTIRIVDRAEQPEGIFEPNIRRNVLYSVIFGLISGISLAFLLEYSDRSLKTADDIQRFTELPFLGMVPKHDEADGNGSESLTEQMNFPALRGHETDLLMLYEPNSVTSEAIKTARTSLLLSFPEVPPSNILVTSSRPGEGKTFFACNLAISLAQIGKKVVLIDADMRNPRIHRIWNVRNERGLSRYLTSDAEVKDVIVPTPITNLSLITSGPKTPRPAELLAAHKLEELVQKLKKEYDHIILDSPPLIPVADSLILAAKCSCVIMVIHGGVTPREVVLMATQKLSKSEAPIAGAVLNCINLRDPYYHYNYYSSYAYRYDSPKDDKMLPGSSQSPDSEV